MCGILLNIFKDEYCEFQNNNKKLIKNRGPDSFKEIQFKLGNNWISTLIGSVLWTQGNEITVQPLINSNGSFLLWNGDVFDGLPKTGCDSEIVFEELLNDCLATFPKICGPYSFIYYDSRSNYLWFGRDPLGRHSLLWSLSSSKNIFISSVSSRNFISVDEVPSYGIFKIDLSQLELEVQLHPWGHLDVEKLDLKYPCSMCSPISHPCFQSPVKCEWYSKEPQDYELAFLKEIINSNGSPETMFERLVTKEPVYSLIKKLKILLTNSVHKRIETKPNYCNDCISQLTNCKHSKIGILFSGGLDSTLLALFAANILPNNESIDLYNVAFNRFGLKNNDYLVPDRKNGYESLKELQKLCPDRQWNFVEINIDKEELEEFRREHIADLIHPLTSILDDSLGCALWFAARGQGILNGQPYISPARVVLLGMGADEIFGGYSRHRKEFQRYGWTKLGLMLIEEVRNIGRRNLGRDNRVVTDHGRQPRLPFLDEHLLQFATSLSPWQRCCLDSNLPSGVGDKLLLRSLAWNLGLRYSSILPKKALQFGSKIANPKEKGHEKSDRLL